MDRIYEAFHGNWGGGRLQRETQQRMEWIRDNVRGDRILDVGCSQGILEELILGSSPTATMLAIDPERRAIDFALETVGKQFGGRVAFECVALHDLPRRPEFDTVVIGQVLEHIDNPSEFLSYASGFLADGGRILVTVPYGLWEHEEHEHTFYCETFRSSLPSALHVKSMELRGARLAAVLVMDATQGIDAGSITELELSFFEAKERRYLDNDRARVERAQRLEARVEQLTEQRNSLKAESESRRQALEERFSGRIRQLVEQREKIAAEADRKRQLLQRRIEFLQDKVRTQEERIRKLKSAET